MGGGTAAIVTFGRHVWAVAVLMLLSAVLCFHGIAAKSLWNDEAFSFFVSWRGAGGTIDAIRQDSQPPFYYLLLSQALQFGQSVTALRALSACSVIAAVPFVADAGRRLIGPVGGLLAALFFVVTPEVVGWGQIARPYALQVLLVAVSFWGFARLWGEAKPGRPAWLAYVLGGGLAVLAQYPAVFFLLGCNVAMLVRVAMNWPEERRLAWRWVLAQFGLGLVWLPWLPQGIAQVTTHLAPGEIAVLHTNYLIGTDGLIGNLLQRFGVAFQYRLAVPFALLSIGIVAVALWSLRRDRRLGVALACCVFVPMLVCTFGFFAIHPVFGYVLYTMAWLRVAMVLLFAIGVLAIPWRWVRYAVLAGWLGANLLGLRSLYEQRHVPLDEVAALIASQQHPGDGLMLSHFAAARWGIGYYLGPPYAGRIDGLDVLSMPITGWPISTPEAALHERRLWVVLPDGETLAFDPAMLAPSMRQALHQRIGGVLVERYDKTGP